MLETKEQKQIFAGSIVLIIILGLVSFWNHPSFVYQDTTNYAALQTQSNQQQQGIDQYLASVGTTEDAQKAALEQILPPAELQAEVASALDVSQTIKVPTIPNSEIVLTSASGKAALQNYLQQSSPLFDQLQADTNQTADDIYNPTGDSNQVQSLLSDLKTVTNEFQKIPTPLEAAAFHKNLLVALQSYQDLLNNSLNYTNGQSANPWPEVYKDYSLMATTTSAAGSIFTELNNKYNLLGAGDKPPVALGSWLVPQADAQLATIDVWQKAEAVLEQAAATSIAQFMLDFLNKLATKIESSYRISNFLYYTDALVSGEYVDDYLNKYVADPTDRVMIKNFIPAVSCGNTSSSYNQVFQAKADQYLGFNPSSVSPNDPNYYEKLARVGDFLSSPDGWEVYYENVADEANAAATNAANNEILSSGQKAGRNSLGSITTPTSVTSGALAAIFQRYVNEGSDTSSFSDTQQIASQISQAFLTSFVLQGVVLVEQKACIGSPQQQLVTQLP